MRPSLWIIIAVFMLLQACSSIYKPPQPWERDILAQEKMSIGGDAAETSADDHIYFSKEASRIGRSIGGGGCGCN